MQKSPDFVGGQNRPILSTKIEHVLSSTILLANFLYIGQPRPQKSAWFSCPTKSADFVVRLTSP